MALCVELVAFPYHFDEFPAPELEIYVFVVAEDGGVVCGRVFEGFIDVAVEDGCADFCILLVLSCVES